MAAKAAASECPSSRTGHDAAALRVLRSPFDPRGNSMYELLPAACDSYRVFALFWEGASAYQPSVSGEKKELLCGECTFDVDDGNRSSTAALGVPACSSRHRWSPPLLIIPPIALAPLVLSNFFFIFKSLSCVFLTSSHLLVSVALCGQ